MIYCYDPRTVGVPAAVAREFGEVYPGDIITDAQGNKVASTTTLFEVVVAGGRAIDALRSITVAQRILSQSLARDLGPKGIHVAYVKIRPFAEKW